MSVFDEVFYKAKDMAKMAGDKTSEVFETSKVKFRIMQINSDIRNIHEQIGSSVYTMVKTNYKNDQLIYSLVEKIDNLLEEQKSLENKLAQIKNMIVCVSCEERNHANSIYCSKCGYKLKTENSSSSDNTVIIDEDNILAEEDNKI